MIQTKYCPVCGNPFSKKESATYCSESCRQKAKRNRKENYLNKELSKVVIIEKENNVLKQEVKKLEETLQTVDLFINRREFPDAIKLYDNMILQLKQCIRDKNGKMIYNEDWEKYLKLSHEYFNYIHDIK